MGIAYTPEMDAAILELVATGFSTDDITDALREQFEIAVTRGSVYNRQRQLAGSPRSKTRPQAAPARKQIKGIDLSGPVPSLLLQEGLIAISGDRQRPLDDPIARELYRLWTREVRPKAHVFSGDEMDQTIVSRHALNPKVATPIQGEIDYTYEDLKAIREAADDAVIAYVPGNHEMRIEALINKFAPRLAGIRPAGSDLESLSLRRLLNLDDLDIAWIDDAKFGGWPFARLYVPAADALIWHGTSARKGAGQSVRAQMDGMEASYLIQGHCHRQAVMGATKHKANGSLVIRTGVETGTMSCLDGLGYAATPDWQPGWVTLDLLPGGHVAVDLATVRGSSVVWRGQVFTLPKKAARLRAA